MSSPAAIDNKRMPGRATPQGTLRYAARFQGRAAPGHFREAPGGLVLSSIGIGTYLGEPDEATDNGYADAVVAAVGVEDLAALDQQVVAHAHTFSQRLLHERSSSGRSSIVTLPQYTL